MKSNDSVTVSTNTHSFSLSAKVNYSSTFSYTKGVYYYLGTEWEKYILKFLFNDKAVLTIADMAHFRCYDYDNNLIGEWCFEDAGLTFPESTKFPLGCVDGKLFFRVQPLTEDPNMGYLISCVPEENRFEVVQAIPRG